MSLTLGRMRGTTMGQMTQFQQGADSQEGSQAGLQL